MSYLDRLEVAVYQSPSGSEHTFAWEDLERSSAHRIGKFEFSRVDGTEHQDHGVSGDIYPLQAIFHGEDYDLEADAFAEALNERGHGFLTHPRWGKLRVQVLSSRQAERFVNGVGQALFSIRFQEDLAREFPTIDPSAVFAVPSAVKTFIDEYVFGPIADALSDKNALKQSMGGATATVKAALEGLASNNDDVSAEFLSYIKDIEDNIDDYVDAPQGFADSILGAIQIPATISGRVDQKLQSYSALLSTVTGSASSSQTTAGKNMLLVDELIGSGVVVSMAGSVNEALANTSTSTRGEGGSASVIVPVATEGFRTRAEVLAAAVYLRDEAGTLLAKLDDGQVVFRTSMLSDAYVQALEGYNPLAGITATVIRAALDLSFSLPSERIKTLYTDSTITNECYELYGNIDDVTLDYFILTNSLAGGNILLIPKGTEITYYV